MIEDFAGKELPSYLSEDDKIEDAAAWLDHLARHPRDAHSYYYVYVLPDRQDESEVFQKTIEKLQEDYEAVAFINLKNPRKHAAESRPLFLLNELLQDEDAEARETDPALAST